MLPRVQTAVDVRKAIDRASDELDEIGFDASVLKAGCYEIQGTLEDFADRCPSPDPDETTLVVPDGGIKWCATCRTIEPMFNNLLRCS